MSERAVSKKHYQQTRGKIHLCASLRKSDSFVQLCIESKDELENKEKYLKLLTEKEKIHKKFGEELVWEEKENNIRCTVSSKPLNIGIAEISKHTELQDLLTIQLIKIDDSLKEYYPWLGVV
ncbi:MAG: DUF4268 domain-containing protein [Proteobacteria bacterium]|nr:DUF4268 domain-containing protein [Pseudomonadota bacterium]MBU1648360.1 DUF4268 domain-containing protein [Pseudomonadota bacterium]